MTTPAATPQDALTHAVESLTQANAAMSAAAAQAAADHPVEADAQESQS